MEIKAEEIKIVEIDSLIENPENNNRHSLEQLELLKKGIKYNGFRNPIIVSNRSGFIIAGHARLHAAKELGMTKLPVVFEDFRDEAEEYQYLTFDNESARWSELDKHAVYVKLEELPEIDPKMLGIQDFNVEIEKIDDFSDKNSEIDLNNFGNDLEHSCPKCGFEFND